MSLKPMMIEPVPALTIQVARAAFPRGNIYLTLRDELGGLFKDEAFADLFARCGQPALPPWRLAVVTLLQFRENLSDRQAAEAVRARIDWKYLLGLELSDPGFDFSVLSEFRARLVKAGASERLLDLLLAWCQRQGWLRARGRQRTDATHVLAAVRQLNRLELVAETLRAALNAIATVAPGWLQARVPEPWYQRYGRRIEYTRRPSSEAERQAKGQSIGEDGLQLLSWLEAPDTPAPVTELLEVQTLRTIWQRHYRREPVNGKEENPDKEEDALLSGVQLATPAELAQASQAIESPYDVAACYRTKSGLGWMGYTVHLSETCEANVVHLITHVKTTPANVAEAKCTEAIQHALLAQGRARVFIWPMPVTSRPISSLAARLNGVLPCWGRYVRAPVGRTRSRAPMAGRNSPLTDWLRPLTAHKVTARSAGMRFSTPTAIAISRLILPPRTVRLVPSAAAVPAPKCSHVAFNCSPKLSNKPFNTYGLT